MAEDASVVQQLQEAVVEPDLPALFRLLNALDSTFDRQAEHEDETVLSHFVTLSKWQPAHRDALEALLAKGFDPTYATSQYFNPSEELEGVPEDLHRLLSAAPNKFKPNIRVQRWLDTPLDRLDEVFGLVPPAPTNSTAGQAQTAPVSEPATSRPAVKSIPHAQPPSEKNAPTRSPFASDDSVVKWPFPPLWSDPPTHVASSAPKAASAETSRRFARTPSPPSRYRDRPSPLPSFKRYTGRLPPNEWNEECDLWSMSPPACAAHFCLGRCARPDCNFSHEPLPWAFSHEFLLPGSAKEPMPEEYLNEIKRRVDGKMKTRATPSSTSAESAYEPYFARLPPPNWREAWLESGGQEPEPCAHFFVRRWCQHDVAGDICKYSHKPLPRNFHHINLPPDAPREAAPVDRDAGSFTSLRFRGAAATLYQKIPLGTYRSSMSDAQYGRERSPDRKPITFERRDRSRSPPRRSLQRESIEVSRSPRRARSPRRRSLTPPRPRSPSGPDSSRRCCSPPRRRSSPRSRNEEYGRELSSSRLSSYRSSAAHRSGRSRSPGPRRSDVKAENWAIKTTREAAASSAPAPESALPRSPRLQASTKPPPLREPDLSSLDSLGLNEQQKQLISQSITNPIATGPSTVAISLANKQTSVTEAKAALRDTTPAFPDDKVKEQRYRGYLRFCAGDAEAAEHLHEMLSSIATYNDQMKRWTERAVSVGKA